jgi:hypothetical protein
MAFRVFWAPSAELRLAKVAAISMDRDAIAAAAKEFDRVLISTPNSFGESREENFRVGFIHPLGIYFEVMADVETVIVHDVWRTVRK